MTPQPPLDISIVGDCNLDIILYGLPDDLPVERELLAEGMALTLGGSAAIATFNLARLGNSVGFICALVNDPFGRTCTDSLLYAGVDLSAAVRMNGRSTGVSVLTQHAGCRRILTYPGVTHSVTLADLNLGYLCARRHVHLASFYLQRGLTKDIPKLLETIKQHGVTVSLDPNDDPQDLWEPSILEALRCVDVFLPYEEEACRISGKKGIGEAIEHLRRLVPLLVVKRGSRGASAFAGNESWEVPAYPVEVVDAVGAGDSFDAGFLHGFLREWPVKRSLSFGALTGAWSTTASGGTIAFSEPARLQGLDDAWRALEKAARP